MSGARDPIEQVAEEDRDLYDVATWEPRSLLDRFAVWFYGVLVVAGRLAVILLALGVVVAQFVLGGIGVAAVDQPILGAYVLLSILPALALAAYVWSSDASRREPLRMLVGTFLLGFLFAGFAAVLNSSLSDWFDFGVLGMVAFFFLVVGPVEETVKLLAVRLWAYRRPQFHAVVDGAVYGAMAGLGFATIENTIYIAERFLNTAGTDTMLLETFQIAAVRTFAGPGHVIYSAFAGYYLGLAKFNSRNRGPIVLKGLLIAVAIHALYNTSVTILPSVKASLPYVATLGDGVLFIGFVIVYDGVFGYLLYRKLARYRRAYRSLGAGRVDAKRDVSGEVDREEFERSV